MKYLRHACIWILALGIFLGPVDQVQAVWIYTPETGKWTNPKKQPKDTPHEQFNWAKEFFDEGKYKRALEEFIKLIEAYPQSKIAAEGQFFTGLSYEALEDVGKAAEAYRILVDRYPYSDQVDTAIKHEYEMAELMLGGQRTKVLGIKVMPAVDIAAELYKHIVRSAPYGEYGAKAQSRVGDAYVILGEYDLAQAAYQAVIDNYPGTEYATKARYLIAQSFYKSTDRDQYSINAMDSAIKQFESFKKSNPESELVYEANDIISQLRLKKAESVFEIAQFYEDRGKYVSAEVYYRDVYEKFPDSPLAAEALTKAELMQLIANGEEVDTGKGNGWWKTMGLGEKDDTKVEVIEEKKGSESKPWWDLMNVTKQDEASEQATEEVSAQQEQATAEPQGGKPWWDILGVTSIGEPAHEKESISGIPAPEEIVDEASE